MSTVTVNIPREVKNKLWLWDVVSYDTLISKSIWKEFVSPDLKFTSYDDMSDADKLKYDKLDQINKQDLLNI